MNTAAGILFRWRKRRHRWERNPKRPGDPRQPDWICVACGWGEDDCGAGFADTWIPCRPVVELVAAASPAGCGSEVTP
jgi:hypothetical protein